MKITLVVLALFAAPVAASPVEKVVELIKELQAKLEQDQKSDQQIYDKYACWCETTTGRKAAAIHMAQERIQELGTTILELKGKVAVLSSEVAELTTQIAENEEAQKKATSIREKGNAEFMAEKAELEQAIAALEKAVVVLSGAGAGAAGLLQENTAVGEFEQLKTMAVLRSALRSLPPRVGLTPKQLSAVEKFTQSFEPEAAGAGSSYSPQSATIQGILKDMYDTFSNDLESQTEEEAKAQKNFEDLIATKVKALKHMQSEVKDKESQKAEAEVQLADASQELDDTTKQMKADIEFFDLTKTGCQTKSDEWSERSKMFTGELEGIKKALEILTSDDAKELFSKAIKPGVETGFLQLGSVVHEAAPAMKAYRVLKAKAAKAHSLRLATLAATVRMGTSGHFDKVIEAIDKMIEVLKGETQDDIKQRDWCTKEYHENSQEKAETKWLIEKNEAMIVKLEKTIGQLTETLEDTEKEIEVTKEQMKQMESERTDENDAFKSAKKDDEDAIELLGQAIEALSKYYTDNKIEMGPIQGAAKALLQEPEFEVDPDQAPDATLSKKGARKNQSKGIIGILTMLKEDLQDEITNGVKDEESAQLAYEKQMKAAEKLIEALGEKKVNLEGDIADTNQKKDSEEETMKDNKGDLAKNEEYRKSVEPDCNWMMDSFDERTKRRAAEMDGLVQAKEFLAGAEPGASFLQRKH